MDYYLQSLKTMQYILNANRPDSCFENWAKWIGTDIADWECNRYTEHHIKAYGGMGSFNDLPQIRGGDGNYSIIFELLRSFCYQFAHLYGKVKTSLNALQEDILNDVCNADSHPYKSINKQVRDYLRAGTLLNNIDAIR